MSIDNYYIKLFDDVCPCSYNFSYVCVCFLFCIIVSFSIQMYSFIIHIIYGHVFEATFYSVVKLKWNCFFFACYYNIVDTNNAEIKVPSMEECERAAVQEKHWINGFEWLLMLISFFYFTFEGGQNHFVSVL